MCNTAQMIFDNKRTSMGLCSYLQGSELFPIVFAWSEISVQA